VIFAIRFGFKKLSLHSFLQIEFHPRTQKS
jgi:hypothetical protein